MHDRAAAVDVEIAHLQRSLVQIELYVRTVRRQNNWDGWGLQLTEAWAHLGWQFRRWLAGATSGGTRWIFF